MKTESEIKEMIHRIGNNPNLIGAGEKKALEWVLDTEESAMCEANSNVMLDEVREVLCDLVEGEYRIFEEDSMDINRGMHEKINGLYRKVKKHFA
jgi:hypothetical protein